MAIKIIKQVDVHVTEGELERYRHEWQNFMRYRVGPYVTLEEFIRGRQREKQRKAKP